MPAITATQEGEMGGSKFEVRLGKKLARPCLKRQVGHGGI
jgi:hypothetical protein